MATKYCRRNEGKLIVSASFARLPDGSTVSFRYHLLEGDTAVPSGLLARLCHTFLVSFFFSCFYSREIIYQDPQDRFSQYLHQMIGICLNTTDLDHFL